MSCRVANATIDYNAVTLRTKLVDQQGFGGPAKGGSNDIMDRHSVMQLFFTNDHRRVVRRERVSNKNGCNGSQAEVPTTSRASGIILTPDPQE